MARNRAQRGFAIAGMVLALCTLSASAGTIRVPADYPTIQAAIEAAVSGVDEVCVADGIYTGPGNRDIDFGGKAITVRSLNGAETCIIDCGGSAGDPHRAFLFQGGESASSVLDGFTIRNGYMNRGGALMCRAASSPLIHGCVFRQNVANALADSDGGGAIYLDASHPSITNCRFVQNHAELNVERTCGGALFIAFGSSPLVRDCEFTQNSATGAATESGGGAIQVGRTSSPVLTNCTFVGNFADEGGAVRIVSINQVVLSDCVFRDNTAISDGVGVGGAIVCGNPGQRTFRNCVFERNSALNSVTGAGGAVALFDGQDTLTNCQFIENHSDRIGGGLWIVRGAQATVADCTFLGNSAGDRAGGVAVARDAQAGLSNCIFVGNVSGLLSGLGVSALDSFDGLGGPAHVTLANCTFSNNVAPPDFAAIGVWVSSSIVGGDCILWNDEPNEVVFAPSAQVSLPYSDVQGGWFEVGNIDADPLFVRNPSDGGDGWHDDPNTPEDERDNNDYGDLRLTAPSPCIDSGNPALLPPGGLDFEGRIRVWDGNSDGAARIDMGAYEFSAPIPGDLDGDCGVGLSDLTALLAHFGTGAGATYADGDLNFDGTVDLSDLALMLAAFGSVCG